MRIFNIGRGNGKTTLLVCSCYMNGYTLVVESEIRRRFIQKDYPFGDKIDNITIGELLGDNTLRGKTIDRRLVFDEVDTIFSSIIHKMGYTAVAGTLTAEG